MCAVVSSASWGAGGQRQPPPRCTTDGAGARSGLILQVNTPSTYDDAIGYETVGADISCNLGSLNIANAMASPDMGATVETAVRGLTSVSDQSDISAVPSVARGNDRSHASAWVR